MKRLNKTRAAMAFLPPQVAEAKVYVSRRLSSERSEQAVKKYSI
jgi:hypothetical protein